MTISIQKVTALPSRDLVTNLYPVNTLFFVKAGDFFELHLTSNDGATIKRLPTVEDINSNLPIFSTTPPPLPSVSKFWYHTGEGSLYVAYDDGTSENWVEALSTIEFPTFAGNGTAETMSRSDHHHDSTYVKLGAMEW